MVTKPKPEPPMLETKVQNLRYTLPGQRDRRIQEEAILMFGPTYGHGELSRIISRAIPFKLFHERTSEWTELGIYRGMLPDGALEKYAAAKTTGLFQDFWIIEPRYGRAAAIDPWIVGRIRSETRHSYIVYGLFIVIATWR